MLASTLKIQHSL